MIIDTHYHYSAATKELMEAMFQIDDSMIRFLHRLSRRTGKDISLDDYKKIAAETWGDPTGERMIENMDEAGVDISVLIGGDNLSDEVQGMNKQVGKIAQKYPDRVIALAAVDPRRDNGVDMLKQCFEEFGAKGLKYHPDAGYDPGGKDSYKLLEVVSKYNGILVTHTGPMMPPGRSKLSDPMLLADIAVDFPDIKVIGAHMGGANWRSWASLALFQPNFYGDLAGWDLIANTNYSLFCRELRHIIDWAGLDKILFGTDMPYNPILMPLKNWVQLIKDLPVKSPDGISFTNDEVDAILGKNAESVLGLNNE